MSTAASCPRRRGVARVLPARVVRWRRARVNARELTVIADVDRLGAHLLAPVVADHAQLVAGRAVLVRGALLAAAEIAAAHQQIRTVRVHRAALLHADSEASGGGLAHLRITARRRRRRVDAQPAVRTVAVLAAGLVALAKVARQRALAVAVEKTALAGHRRLAVRATDHDGEQRGGGENVGGSSSHGHLGGMEDASSCRRGLTTVAARLRCVRLAR